MKTEKEIRNIFEAFKTVRYEILSGEKKKLTEYAQGYFDALQWVLEED